jgi:hypothetical protein
VSYYRGDYYRGDYYRGDPFLGALAGAAIKKVGGAALRALGKTGAKTVGGGLARVAAGAGTVAAAAPIISAAIPRAATGSMPISLGPIGIDPMSALPGGRPLFTFGQKKRRKMNPLNPKALRRALRRSEGFEKMAARTVNSLYKVIDGRKVRTFKRKTK